jgi:hypothetical protein
MTNHRHALYIGAGNLDILSILLRSFCLRFSCQSIFTSAQEISTIMTDNQDSKGLTLTVLGSGMYYSRSFVPYSALRDSEIRLLYL